MDHSIYPVVVSVNSILEGYPVELWIKIIGLLHDPIFIVKFASSCKALRGSVYRLFLLMRFEIVFSYDVNRAFERKDCKCRRSSCRCNLKKDNNKNTLSKYRYNDRIVTNKDTITCYIDIVSKIDFGTNSRHSEIYGLYTTYGMCLSFIRESQGEWVGLELDFIGMTQHYVCDETCQGLYLKEFALVAKSAGRGCRNDSQKDILHYQNLVKKVEIPIEPMTQSTNPHLDVLRYASENGLEWNSYFEECCINQMVDVEPHGELDDSIPIPDLLDDGLHDGNDTVLEEIDEEVNDDNDTILEEIDEEVIDDDINDVFDDDICDKMFGESSDDSDDVIIDEANEEYDDAPDSNDLNE